MSLMQLLTVGHSFMDVKNVPSPYRVNRRGLLPRFDATAVVKGAMSGAEARVAGEKPAELDLFGKHNQTLMTPETGSMASAASEATVPASSAKLIKRELQAQFSGGTFEPDLMRPRVKIRQGQSGTVPGTVVLRQDGHKVFKKLVLDRLYWPAWMFSSAVVEPNRRRGIRGTSKQAVRVVRNSLSLSDVEIVATPPNKTSPAGWRGMPLQAWNWLIRGWRGGGSCR